MRIATCCGLTAKTRGSSSDLKFHLCKSDDTVSQPRSSLCLNTVVLVRGVYHEAPISPLLHADCGFFCTKNFVHGLVVLAFSVVQTPKRCL